MKKLKNKGFTLIELLVVVAIIAILALIVLLALNPVEMSRRSRDSRRMSDLGTIRSAVDLALANKQLLKDTSGWVSVNTTSVANFAGMDLDLSRYMSVAPRDPMFVEADDTDIQVVTSACGAGTAKKSNMSYEFKSDGDVYVIRARLESKDNCDIIKQDGNSDDYYEIGTDPGLDL